MTTYHITLRDRETQTVLAVNREPPRRAEISPYWRLRLANVAYLRRASLASCAVIAEQRHRRAVASDDFHIHSI